MAPLDVMAGAAAVLASLKLGEVSVQWLKNMASNGDHNADLLGKLLARVEKLEKLLEVANATIDSLQSDSIANVKDRLQQQAKIESLEGQMLQIKASHENEIQALRARIAELEAENAELQSEIRTMTLAFKAPQPSPATKEKESLDAH